MLQCGIAEIDDILAVNVKLAQDRWGNPACKALRNLVHCTYGIKAEVEGRDAHGVETSPAQPSPIA
jgi:hypothetical protein